MEEENDERSEVFVFGDVSSTNINVLQTLNDVLQDQNDQQNMIVVNNEVPSSLNVLEQEGVGSGHDTSSTMMLTALTNITHPLHRGMQSILNIIASYEDLSASTSQVANAIVNLFPGQYATVELMSFFANLSTAILKSLSGDHNNSRQDAMADILTLDCQQIESFFSGQNVTVVRQISLGTKAPDDDNDDTIELDEDSNAIVVMSPGKKRKRRSLSVNKNAVGFGWISKEVIQVQYLHELTNRINQEVELLRIRQSTSIEELEAMKKAPMLSQATHSTKLSQSFIRDFQGPIIKALNAKIMDLQDENNAVRTCAAVGSEVEAQGEPSIIAADGESAVSLTDWKNQAFSDLPPCPLITVDKGYTQNMELKKLHFWAEEEIFVDFKNQHQKYPFDSHRLLPLVSSSSSSFLSGSSGFDTAKTFFDSLFDVSTFHGHTCFRIKRSFLFPRDAYPIHLFGEIFIGLRSSCPAIRDDNAFVLTLHKYSHLILEKRFRILFKTKDEVDALKQQHLETCVAIMERSSSKQRNQRCIPVLEFVNMDCPSKSERNIIFQGSCAYILLSDAYEETDMIAKTQKLNIDFKKYLQAQNSIDSTPVDQNAVHAQIDVCLESAASQSDNQQQRIQALAAAAEAERKRVQQEHERENKMITSQFTKRRDSLLGKLRTPFNVLSKIPRIETYLDEIENIYPSIKRDKGFYAKLNEGKKKLEEALACFRVVKSKADKLIKAKDHQNEAQIQVLVSSSSFSSSKAITRIPSPPHIAFVSSFLPIFNVANVQKELDAIQAYPEQSAFIKDSVAKFGVFFNNMVYLFVKKNEGETTVDNTNTIDTVIDKQCLFYWRRMIHHSSCNFVALPMYLSFYKSLVTHSSLTGVPDVGTSLELFDNESEPEARGTRRLHYFHVKFWETIVAVAREKGGNARLQACDYNVFEDCVNSNKDIFYEAFLEDGHQSQEEEENDTMIGKSDEAERSFPSPPNLVPLNYTCYEFYGGDVCKLAKTSIKDDEEEVDKKKTMKIIEEFGVFFNNLVVLYDDIASICLDQKTLSSLSSSSSSSSSPPSASIKENFSKRVQLFRQQCSIYVHMIGNHLCDFNNLNVYIYLMEAFVKHNSDMKDPIRLRSGQKTLSYSLFDTTHIQIFQRPILRRDCFHKTLWQAIYEQSIKACVPSGHKPVHHSLPFFQADMDRVLIFTDFEAKVGDASVTDADFFISVIGFSLTPNCLQSTLWLLPTLPSSAIVDLSLPTLPSSAIVDLSLDTPAEYVVSYSGRVQPSSFFSTEELHEFNSVFDKIQQRYLSNTNDVDWFMLCAAVNCKKVRSSTCKDAVCSLCNKSRFCEECHKRVIKMACQTCNYMIKKETLSGSREFWSWLQDDGFPSNYFQSTISDDVLKDLKNVIQEDTLYPRSKSKSAGGEDSAKPWGALTTTDKASLRDPLLQHPVVYSAARGNIRTCDIFGLIYPDEWISTGITDYIFEILQYSYSEYYVEKVMENVLNTSAAEKPPLPPKILFFPGQLFSCLMTLTNSSKTEFDIEKFIALATKFHFLRYDIVVIIMNQDNNHFYLTTVDMQENVITHRESLNPPMGCHQFKLAKCLAIGIEALRKHLNMKSGSSQPWQIVYSPNTTHQEDGFSCAIIALLYALSIYGGTENQYQMPFVIMKPYLFHLRKTLLRILRDGILPRKDYVAAVEVLSTDAYGFSSSVFKSQKCSFGFSCSSCLQTDRVYVCENVTLNEKCLGIYHYQATKETMKPYVCEKCSTFGKRFCFLCSSSTQGSAENPGVDGASQGAVGGASQGGQALADNTQVAAENNTDTMPGGGCSVGASQGVVGGRDTVATIENAGLEGECQALADNTQVAAENNTDTMPGGDCSGGPSQGVVGGATSQGGQALANNTQVAGEKKTDTTPDRRSSSRIKSSKEANVPVVVATKRYVNKDFLAGATCDPTCNPPHTIKEVHFIDLENKATQDRIKTCSLIDGDSVNTANAGVNGMTPLIGIVNECSKDPHAEQSNTCWFNAFFQSLVWLDPVAECALACLLAEENTSLRYATWNYTTAGLHNISKARGKHCAYIKPILSSSRVDESDHPGLDFKNTEVTEKKTLALDFCRMICLARYHPKKHDHNKLSWCFDFYDWIFEYEKYCCENEIGLSSEYLPGEHPCRGIFTEWDNIVFDLCEDIFGSLFAGTIGFEGVCATCQTHKRSKRSPLTFIQLPEPEHGVSHHTLETFFEQLHKTNCDVNCDDPACVAQVVARPTFCIPSRFVAVRMPVNSRKKPQHSNENLEEFENRLVVDRITIPIALQKFSESHYLRLRTIIEYHADHYKVRMVTGQNEKVQVFCDDKITKHTIIKDKQIANVCAEFMIFEIVRTNGKRKLASSSPSSSNSNGDKRPRSEDNGPSSFQNKQPSSSSSLQEQGDIQVSSISRNDSGNKRPRQIDPSGKSQAQESIAQVQDTRAILDLFFNDHMTKYPKAESMLKSQSIQEMVMAMVSHATSPSDFVAITRRFSSVPCVVELESFDLQHERPVVQFRMYTDSKDLEYVIKFKKINVVAPWSWNIASGTNTVKNYSIELKEDIAAKEKVRVGLIFLFDVALNVLSACHHFFRDRWPTCPAHIQKMFCLNNLHDTVSIELEFDVGKSPAAIFEQVIKRSLQTTMENAAADEPAYGKHVLRLLMRNTKLKILKGSLNREDKKVSDTWTGI